MNRTIHILSAIGALSAAVASSAHATAIAVRADAMAAHASAAPLQGGKGHGGGQHGGGGQHARGNQGGGGGRHQASAQRDGGHQQARGGQGHTQRTAAHVTSHGRGNGGGERALHASRNAGVERGRGHASRSANVAPRGATARIARTRGNDHAMRLLSATTARGRTHGLAANAVGWRTDNGRVRLLNRRGVVLMDLPADRYDDIGYWRLRRMGDWRPRGNAPSFCRSGDGHPVWGRQWCLDKGFGLGSRAGTLWSRATIDDVVFRRYDYGYGTRLDRGGLLGVLGDVVLSRLALQALGLGYDQPLMGTWVAEPRSPRLLRVYSGPYPVAEFVDTNYDNRPEVLWVVQPLYY